MEKKRAFDLRSLAKKQIHHKPPRDRPAGGGGGGGGVGYQQIFMRGGSAPLTLLYTVFHENLCETGTPFAYLLLKIVPLSHTLT